ncbi:hypothetical protein [Allomesorhizobium alhagi]|uniref:Uncharacterized protein n=1 Tax=Mesorhizobium alhagi CCNWXJ12-2 TaxID=1107882 RepID=H0HY74_9HYPH|nr:hypothetical protein [Mesorhizobium alhagi]EHK54356.1 hypothetical protein MAXJ12_25763 [Mesorhizobium alhagi CCNWXJ12-2]
MATRNGIDPRCMICRPATVLFCGELEIPPDATDVGIEQLTSIAGDIAKIFSGDFSFENKSVAF